jgi:Tol biopolymer transport system component
VAHVTSKSGARVWGVLVLGVALGAPSTAAAYAPTPATTPAIAAAAGGRLALLAPSGGIRVVLPEQASQPAWSPDGSSVAFVRGADIYVLKVSVNTLRRLTNTPSADDRAPAWSPSGASLAWASGSDGEFDIWLMNADGTSKQLLAGGAGRDLEPAWDPDGSRVIFATDRNGTFDLWAVNVTSDVQSPLVQLPGDEREPALAPDGSALAFSYRASSNTDVWVATPTGGSPARLTTDAATDTSPAWSPRSTRIAFASHRNGASRIWTMTAGGAKEKALASSRPGDFHPSWAEAAVVRVLPLASENLPDLDQRAPAGLVVIRKHGHFLLGFDSAVDNIGTGPLWIRGSRPNRQVKAMRADQLVELDGGRVRRYGSVGHLHFESHPPHHHWHFQPFERYELRRASDFALLVRDRKAGFCLADHYGGSAQRVEGFGPPRFLGSCGLNRRGLLHVEQGSSIGYTDRYPALFHGQDVDVTGVPAGRYVIVHRANPERTFKELRYDNNAASVLVQLSWPHGTSSLPRVSVLERCQTRETCG